MTIYQPRSLYLSGLDLLSINGSAIYHVYEDKYTRLTVGGNNGYKPSPDPHNHYEVSDLTGGGSWWLAVGTTNAPEWQIYGGGELIDADPKSIQKGNIYRPSYLYFWVPTESLNASGFTPGQSPGWINGDFPPKAPPQGT